MMPMPTLRRIALALKLAAMALAAPTLTTPGAAEAAVIHGPSPGRAQAGFAEAALPAPAQMTAELPLGAAALQLAAAHDTHCTGCGEVLAAPGRPRPSATLSVNVAILVLGSLWLALMLRRIQLRSAMAGLRGAGPQHAAGGH